MTVQKTTASPEIERFSFEPTVHGSGGFAKVIKGRDNALERDIAVKVLDPLRAEFSESDQDRFHREAQILARMSHPNIPAIYDINFSPGRFFIIFQFVEGETLAEIIKHGSVDLTEVRSWFFQLSSALQHAHDLGIVHRDVKPANIIITPDRQAAYLVDFGIALTLEDARKLTSSGYVIGTPGYMAPEQQSGADVDHRADIYSLAVTMYEALAGNPMPQGQYTSLSSTNEAIPPQIDDLVQECLLEKDQRVSSAKTFGTRLQGALRLERALSEVLASGRLYEIAIALEKLSPEQFNALPKGQKTLVLVRLDDIVLNPLLQPASEHFLRLLLTRGLLLSKNEYKRIVEPAIHSGFEEPHGDFIGSRTVRLAMVEAAAQARSDPHDVLTRAIISYLGEIDHTSKEDWFFNGARDIVLTLLANPACGAAAPRLGKILRNINDNQRG